MQHLTNQLESISVKNQFLILIQNDDAEKSFQSNLSIYCIFLPCKSQICLHWKILKAFCRCETAKKVCWFQSHTSKAWYRWSRWWWKKHKSLYNILLMHLAIQVSNGDNKCTSFQTKVFIFHPCKSKRYCKLIPCCEWRIVTSKWEIKCIMKKTLQYFPT